MVAIVVTWPVVALSAFGLAVLCFLAVLWSKREWDSRKIRVGMFLEREYRETAEKDGDEWPQPPRRRDDEDTKEITP